MSRTPKEPRDGLAVSPTSNNASSGPRSSSRAPKHRTDRREPVDGGMRWRSRDRGDRRGRRHGRLAPAPSPQARRCRAGRRRVS